MSAGTVGVVRTPLAGERSGCARLGAVFNLPRPSVTLAEDVLMAAMTAVMFLSGGHA